MDNSLIYVSTMCKGDCVLVGRLWSHQRKGRESATFEYDKDWLVHPERFALDPALKLTAGAFHTEAGRSLFGAIGDSAPDRWGRILMRRLQTNKAQEANQPARTLLEIDYLLGVNDEARQGALRFSREVEGPYLAPRNHQSIPPLVELPRLLNASARFLNNDETAEDLKLLLAPGSSLGGARPKASILDRDGSLAIAKFPRSDDEYDVVIWEAVALTLAKKAKIRVPEWRIEQVGSRPILVVKRFDRSGIERIPFLSAMSMLGAKDNELHSYLELVYTLIQRGSHPDEDMEELWRRIVFSILISNTDDHLRNHGFVYDFGYGWRLSPVYDVNPTPVEIKPRILTTAIDFENTAASLDLALSVASEFRLSRSRVQTIVKEVSNAVSQWRSIAKKLGLKKSEIDRMASAFEHEDLVQAQTF